jgi:flagellar hook-basal body complex protein FliE
MADPLGLINSGMGGVRGPGLPLRPSASPGAGATDGPSFKDVLMQNLRQVNELQQDASRSVEDLVTGKRDDVESVLMATQQADAAFKMLQAVRNKVMDAFEEIKQMRV